MTDNTQAGEYPAITIAFINKHAHPSQAVKLCRADWSGKDESSVETVHPEVIKLLHAYVDADRAMRAQAAPQRAPAPSAAADLIAALEEARSAINSMKVEAETAGQGDEQMMLEACETISNEGLQADMAIRAALASAPQPSPTPQADSQPAPVLDYPPLPDFETVEQHIYGACRRYITQDMLEPIHNLIRDAIDADRAARAPADSVTAPASGATSKNLLQVQKWGAPPQISESDTDYWVRNRALILQAIEDRGFRLVSAGGLFWLHGPSTQAQAGAVPLTDEQIVGVMHSIPINAAPSYHIAFARAIEQAHGIGETP